MLGDGGNKLQRIKDLEIFLFFPWLIFERYNTVPVSSTYWISEYEKVLRIINIL